MNFSGDDVVVGYKAAAYSEQRPQTTLYDAKRFIGTKFTREELTMESRRYPFTVGLGLHCLIDPKIIRFLTKAESLGNKHKTLWKHDSGVVRASRTRRYLCARIAQVLWELVQVYARVTACKLADFLCR